MRAVIVVGAAVVLGTGVAPMGAGAASGGAAGPPRQAAPAPQTRAVCDTNPIVRWDGDAAELTYTRCAPGARYRVSWGEPYRPAPLPAATRVALDRLPPDVWKGAYGEHALSLSVSGVDAQNKTVATGVSEAAPPFVSQADMFDRLGRDLAGRPLTFSDAIDLDYSGQGATTLARLLIEAPYWQVQSPVVRLYRAAFLRLPETAGLDYWVGRRRAGLTLAKVAAHFAGSAELVARYGTLTDRAFVEQVYENVLGRPGEQSGIDYWTQQLTSGARTRGAVLLGFSESAEHRSRTLDLVGTVNVISGLLRRVPTAGEIATPMSVEGRIAATFRTTEFTARLGDVPPLPSPTGDARLSVVGDVGFRDQLAADFASGAVTYSVPTGSTLPPGLSLSPTGLLAGDPAPGAHTFRIAVTDATGATGTNELHLTVRPARTGVRLIAGPCVLDLDGDVVCATHGHGDGTTYAPVAGVAPATDLAWGDRRSCAITAGTVRCWGEWPSGDVVTPIAVAGITTAVQVAVSGPRACAVLTGGTVSCWTDVGVGAPAPAAVALPDAAVQVEASREYYSELTGHACALLDDGTVHCWGANESGQLGTPGPPSATPVAVPGVSDAVEIAVNTDGGCARSDDGTLRCWGGGNDAPSAVDAGVTDLGAEGVAICALLTAGGGVACWGRIAFWPSQSGAGGSDEPASVILPELAGATALDGMGATVAGDRIRIIDPTWDASGPWTVPTTPTVGWIFA